MVSDKIAKCNVKVFWCIRHSDGQPAYSDTDHYINSLFMVVAFSLFARIVGRMFDHWFSTWAFLVRFEVEISSHTLIALFMPGSVHSGSPSWFACGWVFPDKLHVCSFLDRFQQYAWTMALLAHSHWVGSRVYACLGVTGHLHFWQSDRGLLCATAVTLR